MVGIYTLKHISETTQSTIAYAVLLVGFVISVMLLLIGVYKDLFKNKSCKNFIISAFIIVVIAIVIGTIILFWG